MLPSTYFPSLLLLKLEPQGCWIQSQLWCYTLDTTQFIAALILDVPKVIFIKEKWFCFLIFTCCSCENITVVFVCFIFSIPLNCDPCFTSKDVKLLCLLLQTVLQTVLWPIRILSPLVTFVKIIDELIAAFISLHLLLVLGRSTDGKRSHSSLFLMPSSQKKTPQPEHCVVSLAPWLPFSSPFAVGFDSAPWFYCCRARHSRERDVNHHHEDTD